MCELIRASGVTRAYDNRSVLNGISLTVEEGDSIAFVGHNGCGKSTLLRILGGLTVPSGGEVRFGRKLRIGYVPEHFLKMSVTAEQYIVHMGRIGGMNKTEVLEKSGELFDEFFMGKMKNVPMKHLSKGTLQKTAVIQALLVRPDVLMLDEPLSGQDTESQNRFIEKVNLLRRGGTAILMSCHEKYLVGRVSNRIYEIKDGVLRERTLAEIYWDENKTLLFERKEEGAQIPGEVKGMAGLMEEYGGQLKVTVSADRSHECLAEMMAHGWKLEAMW